MSRATNAMMNDTMRDKYRVLDTVASVAETKGYRVPVFPTQIPYHVMLEQQMDREAHVQINEKRAAAPCLPRYTNTKTKAAMFALDTLESAVVDATEIDGPSDVVIQIGKLNPLEYRSCCPPGNYNSRLYVEMVASSLPLAEVLRTAMDESLLEVSIQLLKASNAKDMTPELATLIRKLNAYYTKSVQDHLTAVIDPTMHIDSFMDDYPDLIEMLDEEGFGTAEEEFTALLTADSSLDRSLVPTEEAPLICVGRCILIRLDMRGYDLGFSTITPDMPVMLSGRTHASLLELLNRLSVLNDSVPLVHLQLLDDDFMCHKGMIWGSSWSVVRMA